MIVRDEKDPELRNLGHVIRSRQKLAPLGQTRRNTFLATGHGEKGETGKDTRKAANEVLVVQAEFTPDERGK